MTKYKLLALDLDGTTLTDDKKITLRTKARIQEAVQAGITVIFATGRGIQTTQNYWDELALTGPMVLVNGAEIWKGPGQLYKRHFISKDDIRWLHEQAQLVGAHFWGYSVESLTGAKDWTEDMFERNWLKFGMNHKDEKVVQQLRYVLKSRSTIEITSSAPINIEISLQGISKETGVRDVCSILGISMDEVMAIGDNLNDQRLIQAAGLGVAMGNGDQQLKASADVITDTNENEGVATAIERYLLDPIKV